MKLDDLHFYACILGTLPEEHWPAVAQAWHAMAEQASATRTKRHPASTRQQVERLARQLWPKGTYLDHKAVAHITEEFARRGLTAPSARVIRKHLRALGVVRSARKRTITEGA